MITNEYELTEQTPLAEEYLALRAAVGWWNPCLETAQGALDGSLCHVCVRLRGCLVGYGRIVGDGHFMFYIQDVIVQPEHQGKGLGKAIMDRIMRFIDEAGGEDGYAGLMTARGVSGFYEQFGFTHRPEGAPGMQRWPERMRSEIGSILTP